MPKSRGRQPAGHKMSELRSTRCVQKLTNYLKGQNWTVFLPHMKERWALRKTRSSSIITYHSVLKQNSEVVTEWSPLKTQENTQRAKFMWKCWGRHSFFTDVSLSNLGWVHRPPLDSKVQGETGQGRETKMMIEIHNVLTFVSPWLKHLTAAREEKICTARVSAHCDRDAYVWVAGECKETAGHIRKHHGWMEPRPGPLRTFC